MSLVNLVQDYHIIAAEARIRGHLSQQQSLGEEGHLGPRTLLLLKPDLVSNLLIILTQSFVTNSVCQGDASNSSRLSTSYVGVASIQKILRNLGTLATT